MIQKLKIILMASLMFLCVYNINSQTRFDGYSISPKLGGYGMNNMDQVGYMIGIEANIMKKHFLYSASYYYGNEWIILGAGPDRYFHQASLLFGRYNQFGLLRMDYQAGLAAITGIRHTTHHHESFLDGYYDIEHYLKPGLALEFGLEFVPAYSWSIGTQVNVNINPESTMIGFAISLSFGRFSK